MLKRFFLVVLLLCLSGSVQAQEVPTPGQISSAIHHLLRTNKSHILMKNEEKLTEYSTYFVNAATMTKVPWRILVVIVFCESTFRSKAVGSRGEVGLGQLHGRAVESCSEALGMKVDLTDPETNLKCTALWLAKSMRDCRGSVAGGLTRYASGGVCVAEKGGALDVKIKKRIDLIEELKKVVPE